MSEARNPLWACAALILLIVTVSTPAQSLSFYVDAVNGSDSNDGASPDSPWQTLDRVNAQSFSPGASVRFRSGQTFRGQLRPGSSGTADAPIAFGAWGDGNRPILTGFAPTDGWTQVDGNIWEAPLSGDRPYTVVMNRQFGRDANFGLAGYDPMKLTQPLDWAYDGDRKVLGVYSQINPAEAYSAFGVEAAATRKGAIHLASKENIVLDGLDIVGGDTGSYHYAAVTVEGGGNHVIRNSTIRLATGNGITFRDNTGNTVIENTIIRDNGNDGVYYFGVAANHELARSHIENNGLGPTGDRQAVGVWETEGVRIHDNTIIHSKAGSWAIEFGSADANSPAGGSEIYRNVIDHSAGNSSSILLSSGTFAVHNNLMIGNPSAGTLRLAQVGDRRLSADVFNNTIVGGLYQMIAFSTTGETLPDSQVTLLNNIFGDSGWRHVIKKPSFDAISLDGNLYDGSADSSMWVWNDVAMTFDEWVQTTGQDLTSPTPGDPQFLEGAESWTTWEKYLLGEGSPALEAGRTLSDEFLQRLSGTDQDGPGWDIGALPLAGPGDADLDGDVDLGDYNVLRFNWGVGDTWTQGDFTGDGNVDLSDFNILKYAWGESYGGLSTTDTATAVPEPAIAALLGVGGVFLLRRRRIGRQARQA